MKDLNSNNLSTIIGVCGSLIGVILGFILNQILKLGNIKIFQNKIEYSIVDLKGGSPVLVKKIGDETDFFTIDMQLDFYNKSSQSIRIMRDIKLFVSTIDKKDLFYEIHQFIRSENRQEVLTNINLSPQQIKGFELICRIEKNMQEVLDGKWYFHYRKNNDKVKRVELIISNNGL